jgi:ATP-dependent HslUV protease subunit HslV
MAEAPIYTLKNIHLAFGDNQLFEQIDFSVNKGNKICLVGRNGSGKSTLLKVIAGVIEPDGGVCAIGSGGNYALAAARALRQETDYSAEEIVKKSLKIASEICVFTNDNITCEVIGE